MNRAGALRALGERPRLRASLLAAAALLLYLALGQNMLHGLDAYFYLRDVQADCYYHPRSYLYYPIAIPWAHMLGRLGVPLYESMRALSAVAAALAVWCSHCAAMRLGLAAAQATLVSLGLALTPAVLYSASVVEVDTILLACACAAWVPFARFLQRPTFASAIASGLCTALAAAFHAAGHLLAGSLCGMALGWSQGRTLRVLAPRVAALLGTHLAGAIGTALVAGWSEQGTMASNTLGHAFHLDFLGHVLQSEWLWPYAPFALLAFVPWRHRQLRGAVATYAVCLLVYLYLTSLILGFQRFAAPYLPQGDVVERGTFLFGIALPTLVLSVRSLPTRWVVPAIAAAGVSGIVQIRNGDWPADPPGYAEGLATVLQRGPCELMVADVREWAWVARRHPEVRCLLSGELRVVADETRQKYGAVIEPGHYVAWFGGRCDRARDLHYDLILTARTLATLRASTDRALADCVPLLEQTLALEPLDAQGFHAFVLRRRR